MIGKVERTCPMCSTVFFVAASRLAHGRGVHCSRKCQYASNREKLSKPKVTCTCIGCGAQFERLESSLKNKAGGGKYCTRACRDRYWVGDATPNYQDGSTTHNYGPHWHSTRRSALNRDGHICQHCGIDGELDVHHEVPFRMFDDSETANDLSNLISLCRSCHRSAEALWRWVRIGDCVIRMSAESVVWKMHRAAVAANDNQPIKFGAAECA